MIADEIYLALLIVTGLASATVVAFLVAKNLNFLTLDAKRLLGVVLVSGLVSGSVHLRVSGCVAGAFLFGVPCTSVIIFTNVVNAIINVLGTTFAAHWLLREPFHRAIAFSLLYLIATRLSEFLIGPVVQGAFSFVQLTAK